MWVKPLRDAGNGDSSRCRVQGAGFMVIYHPGGNPWANLKAISQRCYLREVAFERELTEETIYLPLGCLQGGASVGVCEPPCTRHLRDSALGVAPVTSTCRSPLSLELTKVPLLL